MLLFAEVADKCLHPGWNVSVGLFLGFVVLLLAVWSRWIAVAASGLCILLSGATLSENLNGPLAPQLRSEVGIMPIVADQAFFIMPVLALTVIAIVLARHIRIALLRCNGLCRNCRYDLRGYPDSATPRCPECGHRIAWSAPS